MEHKTVLKKETIDLLYVQEGGIYIDTTLGGGGHSLELLDRVRNVTLFCFDLDKSNIEEFKIIIESKYPDSNLQILNQDSNAAIDLNKKNIFLINDNFSKLDIYLEILNIDKVSGVLADLGWSSDQLDSIPGLSYQDHFDELDMRLAHDFGVKASDLLNALGKKELVKMFEEYADIRGMNNQRLVSSIISFRNKKMFETVGDLISVIDKSNQFSSNRGGRRFSRNNNSEYSRVFQALRIAVNSEMSNLRELLDRGWKAIERDGVFSIITFHSGEERMVKNYFNKFIDIEEGRYISNQYGEVFTRPSVRELEENLRSRSAKLWSIKKVS
jgi:16S rRNA (cytosine1402-N4)-methyltransferase